ncbi:MAG: hypothetical protein ACK6AH_12170 [Gemmatimonadota bacterium]
MYGFRPALEIALTQRPDATWNGTMLTVPSAKATTFEGLGTIHAVRRLHEYGWSREAPPIEASRRLLFRLLAEDEDPANAFELAPKAGKVPDLDGIRRSRQIVREAAAMVLAQAGYEADPRLRGAAQRILARVGTYLRSPLALKPWVRVGNRQVLSPDAAPPSIFALWTFAFMPHFRHEHHEHFELLAKHLQQPMPRQEPVQVVGDKLVEQPHLVLGDALPTRNAVEADIPHALAWLELMARLGYLKRVEHWGKLFERFLDDRDADGIWHPHKGTATPKGHDPYSWALFPLQAGGEGAARWTDVTFRLGLIARLMGRPIEAM